MKHLAFPLPVERPAEQSEAGWGALYCHPSESGNPESVIPA